MKARKIISLLLVVLIMVSVTSVAASAVQTELAASAYKNQNYLEDTYASAAYNEKNLGCTYTESATTFKVWAPEADSVNVKLFTTGTDAESGAAVIGTNAMSYNSTTGVWSLTLEGDHKNEYYIYVVNRGGDIKETQDPYATAVGANGNRSMICDLDSTDPDGWESDQHVLFDNPGEAVVWEVHVRDFSIDVSSGVSEENRGKYLAFTEGNTTVNGEGRVASCVDYLVEHNVNCVQLMPIEDFASIDETDDAIKRNWGYDPKNYNVPEGSYSSDPYNGNTRITEFKMLVQALHDRGISVIMDVVYNHTFVLEGSALNLTTPNYYYRKADDVNYIDGTGLGNVLASDKKMVSKYISESLQYWVNEYHIDGFRFDLMGCFDIPNLKLWRSALDKIDRRIIMYGEPWAGGDAGIPNALNNGTLNQLDRIGAFNQTYSDSLKGHHDTATSEGFLNGGSDSEMLTAASGYATYFPDAKPDQFVNYTDNHDNLTLFDKILASNNTPGYITGEDGTDANNRDLYTYNHDAVNNPSSQVLGQMKVALTSALTSQGIPFTVAGTEFCRTKYGDGNSYRTPDEVNAIDWNRADAYSDVADYYAGLVAIREAFTPFTDAKSDAITTVSGGCTAWQISNNRSGEWNKLIVALNNSGSAKSITLSGNWKILANGTKAGTVSLGSASGSYSVPAYSAVILVDSASYGNYVQPNPGTSKVIVEHYTRDSASDEYSVVRTETAVYKEGQTWRASKYVGILFDHDFDKVVSTAAGNATYGSVVAGTTITVKYYYTRNIASGYLYVRFFDTETGERIKTPMKYRLRDGDEFSIPATPVQGYELDTTRYPAMTRAKFDAADPASFDFYYIALPNQSTRVHYYNSKGWFTVLCYAYDDNGNEALGAWAKQTKKTAGMKTDNSMGAGWVVIDVPTTACRVMFHYGGYQVPGQGEAGYPVSGEAWIKDGVVTFNNRVVTSHVDLETGEQLAPDVSREFTMVSSNQVYTTLPKNDLNRNYVVPANSSGMYSAGVTNVVYLYTDEVTIDPGEGLLMGDVDLDGSVSILDATSIQRALAELSTLNDKQKACADVDQDGEMSIMDATAIQRWLAELPTDAKVNQRIGGSEPSGDHTFSEFVDLYNDLRSELGQYNEKLYGENDAYKTAAAVLLTYSSLTLNPDASAEELDTAYEACEDALEGLEELENIVLPDVTIYFTNNLGWDKVYAYCSGPAGDNNWPGVQAEYIGYNNYGQKVYSITLNPSLYDTVVFNNEDEYTVDISYLELSANGFYCGDLDDDEEKFGYGTYVFDPGEVHMPEPVPAGSKMYLVPSSEWKEAGARFVAYFFEGSDSKWVNMKYAGENLYSADIPTGYSKVIFVRMNGTSTTNDWAYKWNQTGNLDVQAGSTYTVHGWEQ